MTSRKVREELGKPWIRSNAGFATSPARVNASFLPFASVMVLDVTDRMETSLPGIPKVQCSIPDTVPGGPTIRFHDLTPKSRSASCPPHQARSRSTITLLHPYDLNEGHS